MMMMTILHTYMCVSKHLVEDLFWWKKIASTKAVAALKESHSLVEQIYVTNLIFNVKRFWVKIAFLNLIWIDC